MQVSIENMQVLTENIQRILNCQFSLAARLNLQPGKRAVYFLDTIEWMTYDAIMAQLESLGDESRRKHNKKFGAGDNQFGVKMGDLRALGKQIGPNPELAKELWASGNLDAQILATLLMKPKNLSLEDLDQILATTSAPAVADYVSTNLVKPHPKKEERRTAWMDSDHDMTARMGWSLTTERVIKSPDGLNISGLLDRIESEMPSAPCAKQWTMNYCLAEIGINFPEHRARALAMGEKIGLYRDYPVSKGCVSPFAPIWITEMVKRKG